MHSRKTFGELLLLRMTRRQLVTALSLSLTTPLIALLPGCGGGRHSARTGTSTDSGGTGGTVWTRTTILGKAGKAILPAGILTRSVQVESLTGKVG